MEKTDNSRPEHGTSHPHDPDLAVAHLKWRELALETAECCDGQLGERLWSAVILSTSKLGTLVGRNPEIVDAGEKKTPRERCEGAACYNHNITTHGSF